MRPLIVHHPTYVAPLPAGHRFPMPKFGALFALLRAKGLAPASRLREAEPVGPADLALAHEPAYVAAVLGQRLGPAELRRLGLPLTAAVVARSRAAVGGTLLTARLALAHGLACNTAGGSHHAFAGFGAGFCVFNDVAVAARVLLAEGAVRRVMVIDLDVHQGDGTAAILGSDPALFTLSVHCRTNFPARKERSTRDLALDPETGDQAYLAALGPLAEAALDGFRPDLVFYNAGVDPHIDDRLGRLALTDQGLAARDAAVLEACRRRGLPLAVVVGGGYAEDVATVAARHALLHEVAAELAPW
ncbi:MAG: histone deacetylase [Geminicoccaceae bacterium]|jgi:acetoin utilization deacetylase AcuC-like enzyme